MAMTDRSEAPEARRRYVSSGTTGTVTVTVGRDGVRIVLVGEPDAREAGDLRRRLLSELSGGPPMRVVVDASAASWLCDDVLSVLGEAARLVEAHDGDLVVVEPPPALEPAVRRRRIRVRASGSGAPPPSRPDTRWAEVDR